MSSNNQKINASTSFKGRLPRTEQTPPEEADALPGHQVSRRTFIAAAGLVAFAAIVRPPASLHNEPPQQRPDAPDSLLDYPLQVAQERLVDYVRNPQEAARRVVSRRVFNQALSVVLPRDDTSHGPMESNSVGQHSQASQPPDSRQLPPSPQPPEHTS